SPPCAWHGSTMTCEYPTFIDDPLSLDDASSPARSSSLRPAWPDILETFGYPAVEVDQCSVEQVGPPRTEKRDHFRHVFRRADPQRAVGADHIVDHSLARRA